MKKLTFILAIAGVIAFTSCGNKAAEQAKLDSIRKADSIRIADSTAQALQAIEAAKAAAEKAKADSLAAAAHADSIAKGLIKVKK